MNYFLLSVFSRCVYPMFWALEAWGQASQAQAPMGCPVTRHALLLLQCMLVLRLGGVASRRGPVLLPESPCHKIEHPLIPHSGRCSRRCCRCLRCLRPSSLRALPRFPSWLIRSFHQHLLSVLRPPPGKICTTLRAVLSGYFTANGGHDGAMLDTCF